MVNAVEVAGFGDIALRYSLFQVAAKSSTRHARIDFESRAENDVANQQWLSTFLVSLLWQIQTQVAEQALKQSLLVRLRFVVGFPILWIANTLRNFKAFGDCRSCNVAISGVSNSTLALNHEFDSKHMLAFDSVSFMIRAGAILLVKIYDVLSVTRLAGYNPFTISLRDVKSRCNLKSSLFSAIHRVFSFLGKHTDKAYNFGCLGHIASAVWLKTPAGVSALAGVFTRLGGGWIRTSESTGCHPVAVKPLQHAALHFSFLFLSLSFVMSDTLNGIFE